MKGIYNLRVKQDDTLEDAKVKNDKLINMVKHLEKKVRGLGTKNTTLQRAFNKTEVFLREVTDDLSLTEVLKQVKEGNPLNKTSQKCPLCYSNANKLEFNGFYVVICSECNYRKKTDNYERPEEET
jgi:hypothetical protein